MKRMSCALLIGAVGLTGCGSQNTFVPPPPPPVTVSAPNQRDVVVYDVFPGRTVAAETVEIRARVPGFLERKDFVDAERVKKGQLLFVIEQEPYIAAVKSAQAKLAQARASGELAKANFLRKRKAYESRAISEIDVLAAQAEYSVATSAVLAAEAFASQAELDLSYTEVKAPVQGRIGRDLISVGNLVGGASPSLLTTLVAEDPIYVYFNLDERTLMRYKPTGERPDRIGEQVPPVLIEFADGTRHPETGRIDYVDNTLDPDTGTLRARAVFSNPGGILLPGLFARVLIPDERPDALLVPDSAIQRDLVGPFLLVADQDDTVQARYIKPGPRLESERIIEEGIAPGDRVIVKGLQQARPGIKVKPMEEQSSGDSRNTSAQMTPLPANRSKAPA